MELNDDTGRAAAARWCTCRGARRPLRSYQLLIELQRPCRVRIGCLGAFAFPPGRYVYTGSARRNLESRVRRHLSRHKRLRWHIDYLLAAAGVRVVRVRLSGAKECRLNRRTCGRVLVPGFGSSDCRSGCGSHLKYQDRPSE